MPRTVIDASRDFDEVRYQRLLADRFKRKGGISEEEYARRQQELAAKDRRYFAEVETAKNPLMAIPLLGAIPMDYLAKKLRLTQGRSPADLNQMAEGYRGLGQGLVDVYNQVAAPAPQPGSPPPDTSYRIPSIPQYLTPEEQRTLRLRRSGQ